MEDSSRNLKQGLLSAASKGNLKVSAGDYSALPSQADDGQGSSSVSPLAAKYDAGEDLATNTGGGCCYRCLLCGRRDKKKETRGGVRTKKAGAFDGLDFDDYWSPVAEAYRKSQTNGYYKCTAAIRWFLIFLIGAVVALVAVLIIFSVRQLTNLKFQAVYSLIDMETAGKIPQGMSFTVFLIFGMTYALIASVFVAFVEPASGSSGIPEIKMILNGVKMPRVTRFKTLACRIAGNIFSVSSGMPQGYEGPMLTIGASIAAGLSQGKSTTLGFDTRFSVYSDFRNDKEKRDFMICGASAGVAAAFNAPAGALLFTMEENASFWHKNLTWRCFFCGMIGAYVIDMFLSGINNNSEWGKLANAGMFSFGLFEGAGSQQSWSIWEIPIFMALGVMGGLFGAMFNQVNMYITRFRIAYVNSKRWLRFGEVAFVSALVSTAAFFIPYFLGSCIPKPEQTASTPYVDSLVSFYCPGTEYNDIASIWFAPTEEAIRQLYHFTDSQGANFSLPHLATFFFAYTALMCLCSGIAVPAGLFIPTLLAGSALGRFVGELANLLFPGGIICDASVYSLIGSAAMLGGTTRMTISLAVILSECTGNYQFSLPIMITLMMARFAGNLFNHGIYDMQIALRKWPLLEERVKKSIANELRVCDIMTPEPLVLREVEKVGRVLDILRSCEHNGFPVVFSSNTLRQYERLGNLAGCVQRRHLAVLLAFKAFHPAPPAGFDGQDGEEEQEGTGSSSSPPSGGEQEGGAGAAGTSSSGSAVDASDRTLIGGAVKTIAGALVSESANGSSRTSSSSSSNPFLTGSFEEDLRRGSTGSINSAPVSSSSMAAGDRRDSSQTPVRTTRGSSLAGGTATAAATAAMGAQMPKLQGPVIDTMSRGKKYHAMHEQLLEEQRKEREAAKQRQQQLHQQFRTASSRHSFSASTDGQTEAGTPRPSSTPAGGLSSAEVAGMYNNMYSKEVTYGAEPLLLWEDLESQYPRYPDVSSINITEEEREMYIDLRPYMDPTPITVHVHCPLQRAFKLYRTLGLRHLLITNNCGDVVGILTRHDLTEEVLHHRYDEVKAEDSFKGALEEWEEKVEQAASAREAEINARQLQHATVARQLLGGGNGGAGGGGGGGAGGERQATSSSLTSPPLQATASNTAGGAALAGAGTGASIGRLSARNSTASSGWATVAFGHGISSMFASPGGLAGGAAGAAGSVNGVSPGLFAPGSSATAAEEASRRRLHQLKSLRMISPLASNGGAAGAGTRPGAGPAGGAALLPRSPALSHASNSSSNVLMTPPVAAAAAATAGGGGGGDAVVTHHGSTVGLELQAPRSPIASVAAAGAASPLTPGMRPSSGGAGSSGRQLNILVPEDQQPGRMATAVVGHSRSISNAAELFQAEANRQARARSIVETVRFVDTEDETAIDESDF